MGKHLHVLSELDPVALTATCSTCGPVGIHAGGGGKWRCARGPRKRPPSTKPRRRRLPTSEHHNLSNVNLDGRTADCSQCGAGVPIALSSQPYARNALGATCLAAKRARRVGAAGLRAAEREALLAQQGGRCAICKTSDPATRWCTDHCHSTGRVRGVLCHPCNAALGLLKDNVASLKAAIHYLSADAEGI